MLEGRVEDSSDLAVRCFYATGIVELSEHQDLVRGHVRVVVPLLVRVGFEEQAPLAAGHEAVDLRRHTVLDFNL